jgi:23S rRNA pseudouridine1911/1915/1917 synthase
MNNSINLHVKETTLLLDFLMKQQGLSRNAAKGILARRQVLVNNTITSQYNCELRCGQVVQITKSGHKTLRSSMIDIVYEDKYLLVINKHEGLLSIATERQRVRTAYNILSDYLKASNKNAHIFIVHRLDRETSGLMVFAKDESTKKHMQDDWHNIVTDRKYVAVLSGEIEKDRGMIVSWLKDNKCYVTYSSPQDNGGDKAVTHYNVIKRRNNYSLVELDLETGRKNQIRVHMQDLQHPVVGDEKYGNGDNPLNRLALHAFKLCFYHPITHQLMEFETPYPPKFRKLFV